MGNFHQHKDPTDGNHMAKAIQAYKDGTGENYVIKWQRFRDRINGAQSCRKTHPDQQIVKMQKENIIMR